MAIIAGRSLIPVNPDYAFTFAKVWLYVPDTDEGRVELIVGRDNYPKQLERLLFRRGKITVCAFYPVKMSHDSVARKVLTYLEAEYG